MSEFDPTELQLSFVGSSEAQRPEETCRSDMNERSVWR